MRSLMCCLVALVVLAVPAAAQTNRSEFESRALYYAIPEPGDITCPDGGGPLPSLMPPWCVDARTKVRNRLLTGAFVQTTDERVWGPVQVVMNMNLDASFHGPVWGSYVVALPGRGNWEGTWHGKYEGMSLATYRLVAHGSGEFDGLELRAVIVWRAGKGESWTGEIIDTRPQR